LKVRIEVVDWTELRDLIKDRMDAQELVSFLDLEIDEVLDAFKDEILEKQEELLEELDYTEDSSDDE